MMIKVIDDLKVHDDIGAINEQTLMKSKYSTTSDHRPFVRGPHFRFFIVSLIAAFILAIVVIVGLLGIFSLMLQR